MEIKMKVKGKGGHFEWGVTNFAAATTVFINDYYVVPVCVKEEYL